MVRPPARALYDDGVPTSSDRASHFPSIEKRYGEPMSHWFAVMDQIGDRKYPEQIAYLRENFGFSQAHANALVMYSRGSLSAKRVSTLDQYLAPFDATKKATVRAILKTVQSLYRRSELVIAWNKPMVKIDDAYVFGVSVHTAHILIAPTSADAIAAAASKLKGYEVNKKTIKVPVDWKPDRALLKALIDARLSEIED